MLVKLKIAVPLVVLALSGSAWAHGGGGHKQCPKKQVQANAEEMPFGKAGDAKNVIRTIRVEMHDTMKFLAAGPGVVRAGGAATGGTEIRLNQGDTVKFVVTNDGKVMHEMVIGTMQELKAHAELMRKHPGMEHDEAYMAHVSPGKKGEIVWQFTQPGEFYYAGLIPGHFEAGMIGRIVVLPRKT